MGDETRDAYRLRQAENSITEMRRELLAMHEEFGDRVDAVEVWKSAVEKDKERSEKRSALALNGLMLLCSGIIVAIVTALIQAGVL